MKITSAELAEGLFGPPARTTIIVGLVGSPDLPPDDVVAVALENFVPDAEIVDLVRADEGPPPPLVIERKHLIYEWGASSAAVEVLMWVGQTAGAMVVEDAVPRLVGRRGTPTGPLERDRAFHTARQTISSTNPSLSVPTCTHTSSPLSPGRRQRRSQARWPCPVQPGRGM